VTTVAFTSELEAVNLLLWAADEAPVQTLSQPGHLPLSLAKAALDETSRVVQSMGWSFNSEDEYPLVRTVDGRIPLAPNMLSVDVDDKFTRVKPVQRGNTLYDRKAHSYVFDEDLTGTALFLLPWDELPQQARQYIAVRASRLFQARMQTGEVSYKLSEADEVHALASLQSFEADSADANFLTDSHSVASVLMYRD
jgi:hypothetical protein